MFKVNNKNTTKHQNDVTVLIVDFEQVNISWIMTKD